eukprot:772693-Prymnesium_polylepis.1
MQHRPRGVWYRSQHATPVCLSRIVKDFCIGIVRLPRLRRLSHLRVFSGFVRSVVCRSRVVVSRHVTFRGGTAHVEDDRPDPSTLECHRARRLAPIVTLR